ncbi:MAG: tetratricopeptide repeat protein, partial [Planctomycetota bacterium]
MRILLALAAAACLTALGCSRRAEVAGPPVPDPDTTGMEAPVVEIIRTGRGRVSRDPDSGEAWSFLAAVLDIHGFPRDAETAYRRALELAPNDPKLPYNLAILLEDRGGDPDEIVGLYRRFAQREPKFPPVHFRIGGVLARKGDLAAAAEAYRTALSLDPQLTIARRSLGQVLIALDEAGRAIG